MKLRTLLSLCAVGSLSFLTACASTQPAQDTSVFDPIEPVNRFVHNANGAVDFMVLYPAAMWYRDIAPQPVKTAVGSFVRNLNEPLNSLNALLQGDPDQAAASFQRFIVNSTIGLLGFNDVATDFGIPYRREDFGQTLGHYGIGGGPYIVLPLLGPSNLRDTTGLAVDYMANPLTWGARNSESLEALYWTGVGATALHTRYSTLDQLNELQKSSIDYYAALRSLYRQQRNAAIRNGTPSPVAEVEDESASYDFDDAVDGSANQ
ncbi:VacJ family lipoprotein [Thalassospira lucentensis]|uniref:MlaA family lipoprotein n=1 Tax=Thalassospira lucentensis TaxID=168935 RepID=UPI003AA836FE